MTDAWIGQRALWGFEEASEGRRDGLAMPGMRSLPVGPASSLPGLRSPRGQRKAGTDPVSRVRKSPLGRSQDALQPLIVSEDGEAIVIRSMVPAMVKPRPRTTQTGHVYMPAPYMAWKTRIAGLVALGLQSLPAIPQARIGLSLTIWAGRGDADNLAGGIMDALNGITWTDDRQIRRLVVDLEERTKTSPRWVAVVRPLS